MSQSSTESSSIPPSSQIPPSSFSSMDYYETPQRHIHHPLTPNSQMSTTHMVTHPPPLLSHSSTLSQASTAAFSIRDSPDIDERPSSPYSSRDSPPLSMIMSTTATPVVHPAGVNPQFNPFPASPSIAASSAGSKRTASGTVKNTFPNSASSVPNSPATPVTPRFARMHTGIDASPKNVSQISTQLRTRLTYALLKLENNWTTESLDQVEARISQGQHPNSPSPRVHIKREPSAGDEHAGAFDSIRRHTRTSSEPNTAHPPSGGGGTGSRTYESFWRDHQANPIRAKILQAKAASQALGTSTNTNTPHSVAPMSHTIHRGGLQPPAQIIPDRDRRSYYNPPRHPPTLTPSGSNLSTYSNYSTASSVSMVANTPPPAGAAAQRTMEQDAVESLMFLSSPGNSRPSSQQAISIHNSQNSQNSQHSQHSQHSQPPIATFHPSPSPHNPSRSRHNYARNATTWPRDRPRHKQARLGLDGIGVAIGPGVVEEDDATDEETGPDSVNARAGGGGRERQSRFNDVSSADRSGRQRGENDAGLSKPAHGRDRMGSIGGGGATAPSPGARGVAGMGGY
ncbi:hypothetical protein P167DRAFT_316868 [Morchella conica CCBAS932]|uniref:Uncharacterized protein n=1 Tax=Morchella conica CCBAS932 TaxID=1392247 RepID=A0A3N4L3R0_9PEZI|nr:hypothetical protein P167DRAFT_316868 [Morchella conica CCBAS932]